MERGVQYRACHLKGAKLDERGDIAAQWYEVLAPESHALLGSFAHRAEAERDIVTPELAAIAA